MLAWPVRLNAQMEEADDVHLQQRLEVEKKVTEKKKKFDKAVEALQDKL